MNHETLKALYQLDVDEVGEEEAAKRWEYFTQSMRVNFWDSLDEEPAWFDDYLYRRKPGIPWPKVMQQKIGTCTCGYSTVLNTVHRTDGPCFQYTEPKDPTPDERGGPTATQWPDNAPEWAVSAIICYKTAEETRRGSAMHPDTMVYIERPKPTKQKIDWSKLHSSLDYLADQKDFRTDWIAWNCDENTRGNPLPDGLVVEWFGLGTYCLPIQGNPDWNICTRFRIVGIKEGWE